MYSDNVRLGNITTMRVGGSANVVRPDSVTALIETVNRLKDRGKNFFVLGAGSNVVAQDEPLEDMVIVTRNMTGITFDGVRITCDSGVSLPGLARLAADRGLSGLEWAVGIPATVGGAIVGNAGAHGGDMGSVVRSVTVFENGQVRRYSKTQCRFGYRDSIFGSGGTIVLSAELELSVGDGGDIRLAMHKLIQKRLSNQPTEPSAGSVFKSVGDTPAWIYIDKAGLRGLRVGGAMVSPKHANFIVNTGGATACDIVELTGTITDRVRAAANVTLRPEIKLLGYIGDKAYDTWRLPYAYRF